jgi:hypothetical protein
MQQQTLHLSLMVCSFYKEGSGHSFAFHPFKYMFVNLLRDVIRRTARFRLHVYTLRYDTATWNQSFFPTLDLCHITVSHHADADDAQNEQLVLSNALIFNNLSAANMHLFP